jgi:hypothetical protein
MLSISMLENALHVLVAVYSTVTAAYGVAMTSISMKTKTTISNLTAEIVH